MQADRRNVIFNFLTKPIRQSAVKRRIDMRIVKF